MKEKVQQFINQFSMFYLIGISYEDNLEVVYVLDVLYKNGELDIINKRLFNTLSDITDKDLQQHYPILIHIDGNNVITKKVENKEGYQKDIIFNSNADEFFFYQYNAEDFIFISTIRLQKIENIKRSINALNRYIVHIAIGPFVLSNLIRFIKPETSISSNFYTLKFNENFSIKEFNRVSNIDVTYNIGGDKITQQETPLLATLVHYLSKDVNISYNTDILLDNVEQQTYKIRSRIASGIGVILILLTLVISHFSLKFSASDLIIKETELATSKNVLDQLNALKQEQILKEKILTNSGVINSVFFSKYLSEITVSVPKSIVLDEIDIKPIQKKIKPKEKITYHLNQIHISGHTNSDASFINWIKELRDLKWVNKIEIIDYEDNTQRRNSFLIQIFI